MWWVESGGEGTARQAQVPEAETEEKECCQQLNDAWRPGKHGGEYDRRGLLRRQQTYSLLVVERAVGAAMWVVVASPRPPRVSTIQYAQAQGDVIPLPGDRRA